MKYQLVLQFLCSKKENYDYMINLEDKLEDTFSENHLVDGHDFGSGEFNIFIHTNDPNEAFEVAKKCFTDSELAKIKVAYRDLNKEKFHIIWPKDFQGEFDVI